MIAIIAAALGLVIAVLRGISLAKVAFTRFRGLGFLAAAVALHVVLNPMVLPTAISGRLVAPLLPGLPPLGNVIYVVSLAFSLGFLYANRRVPGFSLILLGLAINAVVIVANGGQMPGDPTQLARAGLLDDRIAHQQAGLWSALSVLTPGSPLSILADVIYVPMPFFGPSIASVGDFVIAVGVVAFFNLLSLPEALGARARAVAGRLI